MKKRFYPLLIAIISLSHTSQADVAAGLHASTNGLGANITFKITDKVNIKGLVNRYSRDYNDTIDDVDYDFELDLSNAGVLVEWHPTGGLFHVSAGLLGNNNEARGVATPVSGTIDIGNQSFNSSLVGRLEADVSYDSIAPYIGVGWSNSVKKSGWGFAVDLGVIYQGAPDVSLKNIGADASVAAQIDAQLKAEERSIEDDLEDYKFYPVISAGVSYRF